jgi:hypothetical protein
MQRITILGATGSIGVSTLDVLARHPERYGVYALSAQSRVDELAAQCIQFRPARAVVGSAAAADRLTTLAARRRRADRSGLRRGRAVRHRQRARSRHRDGRHRRRRRPGADLGRRARRQEGPAGQQGSAGHVRPAVHRRRARSRRGAAADRQRTQRHLPVPAAFLPPRAGRRAARQRRRQDPADRLRRPVPERATSRRSTRSRRTRPASIRRGRWAARSRSIRRR